MIDLKPNKTSAIDQVRQKIADSIAPSNELHQQLLELRLQDIAILRDWVTHDSWRLIENKMKEAIETQRDRVFDIATDDSEQARLECVLRTAIAECMRMIIGFVRDDIEHFDDVQRELKQRNKIANNQEYDSTPTSDPMLSMLTRNVGNNGR